MTNRAWWMCISLFGTLTGCDVPAGSPAIAGEGAADRASLHVILPIVAGLCTLASGCELGHLDPGAHDDFVPAPGWTVPECSVIGGAPGITLTHDIGETFVPSSDDIPHPDIVSEWVTIYPYTSVVAALRDTPDTLFAVQSESVAISEDAGCTWRYHDDTLKAEGFWIDHSAISWVDAGDGVVYLHDVHNNIVRISEDSIDKRHFKLTKSNGASKWISNRGMTSVPGNPDELVALDSKGDFVVSDDGGMSWTEQGGSVEMGANQDLTPNDKAHFNPSDPAEVIVTRGSSVRLTRDGGVTWKESVFHHHFEGPVLVSELATSPTNFEVVWALVLLMEPGLPIDQQTHLYRSVDSGENFDRVMAGTDVPMNLASMVKPVPQRDHECLLIGDEQLVRVNGVAGTASIHPLEGQVVTATFSPADNDVLYLGFDALSYWKDQ